MKTWNWRVGALFSTAVSMVFVLNPNKSIGVFQFTVILVVAAGLFGAFITRDKF